MQSFGRISGDALELGSFAGGISFELARLYPKLNLVIADERADYLKYLRNELYARELSGRIKLANMNLDKLIFSDGSFDLVILRGAFFFIIDMPQILSEVFRVLRAGGLAFVGGGYGRDIPQNLIDNIAQESRVINDRLGRRRVDIEALNQLLSSVRLSDKAQIVEEGGIWLEIRK
jgi:ubiquinone/menaquinone biosynthesis C-methylase UbiE